jgi:TRAP-type C4-dicarboxylate transport system substrate-binding protein
MQTTEVYTGLERGTLDGQWQNYNGGKTWKTFEVTKYRTENVKISSHQSLIIMNLDRYNSLPADIKSAIDETTGQNRSWASGDIWAAIEEESRAEIRKYDKKVGNPEPYVLPDSEREKWIKAAERLLRIGLKKWTVKALELRLETCWKKPGSGLLNTPNKK